jgi:hypothetical protein
MLVADNFKDMSEIRLLVIRTPIYGFNIAARMRYTDRTGNESH